MSVRRNTTLIALAVAALSLSIVISGCAGNPSSPGGTASPGPDEITPTPDQGGTQASPTAVPTQPVVSYPPAPPKNTFINTSPPANPVKLIFIHHSSGENWLADGNGGLGIALSENNYFVSDTNYDWGPVDPRLEGPIGSFTDTGHWWNWFLGPDRDAYMSALFREYGQHSDYSRTGSDPGGENQIVMFKSCFPNSALGGEPGDPPAVGDNPLDGQGSGSEYQTVGNARAIYRDLLPYFAAHRDRLFLAITAPPLYSGETNQQQAANARAFNRWLVEDWLTDYPYDNVAVFDFYDVLTTNGGNVDRNDAGAAIGNHHRYRDSRIEYITSYGNDFSAYARQGDSHPSAAGNEKATAEFIPLINIYYHRWAGK